MFSVTSQDQSMTFERMMIILARRVGVASYGTDGTETADLPDDADLRDQLKDVVQRGIDLFYTSNPMWTFLRKRVELLCFPGGDGPDNVNGQANRYRLPGNVNPRPVEDWIIHDYGLSTREVVTRTYHEVFKYSQSSPITGVPQFAGIVNSGSTESIGTIPGWSEILFWPTPDLAYTMSATLRWLPPKLADLNLTHMSGREHDETILSACRWIWAQDDEAFADRRDAFEKDWLSGLARSLALDGSEKTRNPARLTDTLRRGNRIVGLIPTRYSFNGNPM